MIRRPESGKIPAQEPRSEARSWGTNGLYREWFALVPNGEKTITFSLGGPNHSRLSSFLQDYEWNDNVSERFANRITVKTTCLAITPPGQELLKTHAAAIWKIEGTNAE